MSNALTWMTTRLLLLLCNSFIHLISFAGLEPSLTHSNRIFISTRVKNCHFPLENAWKLVVVMTSGFEIKKLLRFTMISYFNSFPLQLLADDENSNFLRQLFFPPFLLLLAATFDSHSLIVSWWSGKTFILWPLVPSTKYIWEKLARYISIQHAKSEKVLLTLQLSSAIFPLFSTVLWELPSLFFCDVLAASLCWLPLTSSTINSWNIHDGRNEGKKWKIHRVLSAHGGGSKSGNG